MLMPSVTKARRRASDEAGQTEARLEQPSSALDAVAEELRERIQIERLQIVAADPHRAALRVEEA